MATDLWLGTNSAGVLDLAPSMPSVSGKTQLIQAIARRLQTPPGDPFTEGGNGLVNFSEYGIDLRDYVNETLSQQEALMLARKIEAQLLQDERIEGASCRVTIDAAAGTMTVEAEVSSAEGPFALVLSIGDVTVESIRSA